MKRRIKSYMMKRWQKGDAGWGVDGRLTTYAGARVGLVKEIKKARDIVEEVREGAIRVLEELGNTKLTNKL